MGTHKSGSDLATGADLFDEYVAILKLCRKCAQDAAEEEEEGEDGEQAIEGIGGLGRMAFDMVMLGGDCPQRAAGGGWEAWDTLGDR